MELTNIIALALLSIIVVAAIAISVLFYRKKVNSGTEFETAQEVNDLKTNLITMQETLRNINDNKLSELQKNSNVIDSSLKLHLENIEDFKKSVTEMNKVITSMNDSTLQNVLLKLDPIHNIGEKMEKLNNIFVNKNQRGNYGEVQLNTILADALGFDEKVWSSQERLGANGEKRADAVIFLENDNKIAIDSKFPLESFNKIIASQSEHEKELNQKQFVIDVKTRIDETAKYISPTDKITEAIMFIPSEAIFVDICKNNTQILEHARKKKVIIATPSTIMMMAFTIMEFNRRHDMYKNFGKKIENLRKLGEEFERWNERWTDYCDKKDKYDEGIKKLHNDFKITTGKIRTQIGNVMKENKDVLEQNAQEKIISELPSIEITEQN